jgi:ABC-type phosphate/phosphonate transport system substrate-binding protein
VGTLATMEPLRLVTYLGENTTGIASDLARHLSAALDCAVEVRSAESPEEVVDLDADLSWLCGLLTTVLLDSAALDGEIAAAPVFPGRPGPVYRSVIVSRSPIDLARDRSGLTLAINEDGSWSGHHALRAHLPGGSVGFGSVVTSGGHDASIDLLLDGGADVAAIDDTIWEFRAANDARLDELVVVDRTREWPAPPFTVSRRASARFGTGVTAALVAATPTGLDRIVAASGADYDPIRAAMTTIGSG